MARDEDGTQASRSDEDLVRLVRAGDEAAAAVLHDRHLPLLRAQVTRRISAPVRAKVAVSDVVQNAYLAAFQSLDKFQDRGEGSFVRWLRQIVEHKAVDEIRRHAESAKRDVRLQTGAEPPARVRRGRSPMSEVVAAEQAQEVREAVRDLPSDYGTALRYLLEEGMTAAEAGERMGRSADAVRKLYARALGRLADALDDPGKTAS